MNSGIIFSVMVLFFLYAFNCNIDRIYGASLDKPQEDNIRVLKLSEELIKIKEELLNIRERALNRTEDLLNKRDCELNQREEAAKELNKTNEDLLNKREHELRQREEAFKELVKVKEDLLNKRELELNQREEALKQNEMSKEDIEIYKGLKNKTWNRHSMFTWSAESLTGTTTNTNLKEIVNYECPPDRLCFFTRW